MMVPSSDPPGPGIDPKSRKVVTSSPYAFFISGTDVTGTTEAIS